MFPPLFWGIDFGGMGTGRLGGMWGKPGVRLADWPLVFPGRGARRICRRQIGALGGHFPPTHKKPFSRSDEGVVGIS